METGKQQSVAGAQLQDHHYDLASTRAFADRWAHPPPRGVPCARRGSTYEVIMPI